MKKIFFLIAGLLSFSSVAQEFNIPLQNQYLGEDSFLISSAFAGIGECIQIRGNGITQWVGIDNSPNTQTLSIDGLFTSNSGAGLILFNDSNGATSQRGVQLSYAHHLTLSDYSSQYLSFGISYRYTNFGIDSSEFNRPDIGLRGDLNVNNHNFEVSTAYRLENFFISFTALNLLDKELDQFGTNEPFNIRSYYVYAGYVFQPKFADWEIEPSVFYQTFDGDGRATSDVNIKFRKKSGLENYYWAGASMRFINDQDFVPLYLSPMVGAKVNNFYVGYSYQVNLNRIQRFNSGTHMLTVGIDFGCRASRCGCTRGQSMK
ncbi:MAG: type IX secretion system PorP/SprF family membrane protein [Rubritalea sp.]|jgi:type IX secretion system PorP/SprF family membrane protein